MQQVDNPHCSIMQRNGIGVDETYAPNSKYASLRFLVVHFSVEQIDITHPDIKTAFINAPVEEVVWCDTPPRCFRPPWPQVAPAQSTLRPQTSP
jgi:hypothetical protein